jgi:hypothetical protein
VSEADLEILAAGPIDRFDEQTLARLATLYTGDDPVPPGLAAGISVGITLDALYAELAQLQHAPGLAGVRTGEVTADTVTFSSATLTAMVRITPASAETARVDGWITPVGSCTVRLRTSSTTLTTEADADGRFAFANVTRGMVQFTFAAAGGRPPVITPALEI